MTMTGCERKFVAGLMGACGTLGLWGALPVGHFIRDMPESTHEKPTNPGVDEMARIFRDPFGHVRTGCYWYWISGNVSCEGVVRDLEAMKRAGIDRAQIGDVNACPVDVGPDGKRRTPVRTFSPEWEKALETAFAKAAELDIEIGIFNSPGWSQSGGPWVTHEKAMRRLACGETRVTGPQTGPLKLAVPDLGGRPAGEWQDVAVVAFPTPSGADAKLFRVENFKADTNGVLVVELTAGAPFHAQSVRLQPTGGPSAGRVTVEAFQDGRFAKVHEFAYGRSNDMLGVGFLPRAPILGAFGPTRARRFRVTVRGTKGASFSSVELGAAPGVAEAFEKSFAKMFETPFPSWHAYQWAPSVAELPGSAYDPARAVVLTDRLRKDGTLDWTVPAGDWTVFRLVMTPTGAKNGPANPEATGYEVDKMSRRHIADHVESYLGKILDRTPPAARKAIRYAVMDSYEMGGQNATDDLVKLFRSRYGYDPTPYLPSVYGAAVGSRDATDRFLWDLRRLVADEVAYSYVGGLRVASARRGLKTWLECYGHWGFPGEFLQYGGQSDEIAGEYWSEGDLGRIENRAASSCGHTYGKRLVWCESNTCGGLQFSRGPMDLKSRTDQYFTEGINATLLHVYLHQPDESFPGLIAPFGNEFNRKNTWFDHLDLFTGYVKRCNYLLQQGLNVADIAYFIGEDTPKMTGLAEPAPPKGRQFDFINAEVLCETAGVDARGRLVLPHGTAYEVLVLPPLKTMRPAMLETLVRLVEGGAWVLGPKPERSPSLAGQPEADRRVRELADRLWGEVDGKAVTFARRGEGAIAWNMSLEDLLARRGSTPDLIVQGETSLLFAHRTLPTADIYFVATPETQAQAKTEVSFRTAGRRPVLWDAATGELREPTAWRVEGDRTVVSLALAFRESVFVVFADGQDALLTTAARAAAREAEIAGPWRVTFESDALHRGPAEPLTLPRLKDLSTMENVKHYSGKIVYRTSFACLGWRAGERVALSLGDVAVTAKVRVNGRAVGGVCFAPYRLDVSEFVREGENELEVEVCNLWLNRLVGDEGKADRPTWTSLKMALKGVKPARSGLIGPVRLICR